MDLRAAWEAEAERWLAWTRTPGHDHWFSNWNWPAFVDLLPPPGGRTLDLGCGEGRCGRWLAEHGHAVTGVDGSPTLADHARAAGGYDEVLCADVAALPFPDASFDLVCAFMSLHDVDDLDGAVAELRRVLEPGGRLAAALYHPQSSAGYGEGGYDTPHRWEMTIERGGLEMTFHSMHRPLSDYLEALAGAGLVLEELREPVGDGYESTLFLHLTAVAG